MKSKLQDIRDDLDRFDRLHAAMMRHKILPAGADTVQFAADMVPAIRAELDRMESENADLKAALRSTIGRIERCSWCSVGADLGYWRELVKEEEE